MLRLHPPPEALDRRVARVLARRCVGEPHALLVERLVAPRRRPPRPAPRGARRRRRPRRRCRPRRPRRAPSLRRRRALRRDHRSGMDHPVACRANASRQHLRRSRRGARRRLQRRTEFAPAASSQSGRRRARGALRRRDRALDVAPRLVEQVPAHRATPWTAGRSTCADSSSASTNARANPRAARRREGRVGSSSSAKVRAPPAQQPSRSAQRTQSPKGDCASRSGRKRVGAAAASGPGLDGAVTGRRGGGGLSWLSLKLPRHHLRGDNIGRLPLRCPTRPSRALVPATATEAPPRVVAADHPLEEVRAQGTGERRRRPPPTP